MREESSFHRVVAREELAEQCAQLLVKGRKVFVQGRLAYRVCQKDDEKREVAEIVIEDMLLLDTKPASASPGTRPSEPTESATSGAIPGVPARSMDPTHDSRTPELEVKHRCTDEEIADAIPF
jgi:single-stranded DNA-binding protein